MKQRGRKGVAQHEVEVSPTDLMPRPLPPQELTREEATEWIAIVNVMPPEYFPRSTQPVLAQLCRHVVSARYVAMLIGKYQGEGGDVRVYMQLLSEQRKESTLIQKLATACRLTHQATVKEKIATMPDASAALRPWRSAA